MALALTIAGGVLQFIGLGFTFAELSAIRAYEWHRMTPWQQAAVWWRNTRRWLRSRRTSLIAWFRALWGRHDVEITPRAAMLRGLAAASGSSATAMVTAPRVPPPGSTDSERIEWVIQRLQEHDSLIEDCGDTQRMFQDPWLAQVIKRSGKIFKTSNGLVMRNASHS